jgi:hypothetical protein
MREHNKNRHWVEELDYAIEEWTFDGIRLVEVHGRVHLIEMAHQAFSAAKQMRPASRLMLRRGAQVLREWLPKPL